MHFDDAAQRFVEFAASRHNAIHTTEAAVRGMTPSRLRRAEQRGELVRLRPKVWALAALPSSREQTIRSATLALPGAAAAHGSAAYLHGWFEAPPPIPQIWVPATSRARLPLADVSRFARVDPALDVVEVSGIRTLSAAATLCLIGATVGDDVMERCLDAFLRNNSARWLDETIDRLFTPKAPGPRDLVRVLADPKRVAGVTDSWMERVMAGIVAGGRLPMPVLQHEVVADTRRFRLDLAFPELRLGVEAHSRTFHFGPGKEDADNVRDLALSAEGWHVLYVTWSQLRDPDGFVTQLERVAEARRQQLGDAADLPPAA